MGILYDIYRENDRNLQLQTNPAGIKKIKDYLRKNPHFKMNEKDRSGRTDLHWACFFKLTDLIAVLLEHGADPNIPVDQRTPLHIVIEKKQLDAVKLLLANGADVTLRDEFYQTPLQTAETHQLIDIAVELKIAENKITKKNTPSFEEQTKKTLTTITDPASLDKKELLTEAYKLQESFLNSDNLKSIKLNLSTDMSTDKVIENVLSTYPGMMIGESHSEVVAKRFIVDNISLLVKQGVKVVFFEHLFAKELQTELENYLSSPEVGVDQIPEKLSQSLFMQDAFRNLYHNQNNFTTLIKAIKRHNLKNPNQPIRIVLFETEVSYQLGSKRISTKDTFDKLEDRRRLLGMNFLCHLAIEREKLRFKNENPEGEFKYLGFMGNTHINTHDNAVGVGNFQQVPGIAIRQIDVDNPQLLTDVAFPQVDFIYWAFSSKEKEKPLDLEQINLILKTEHVAYILNARGENEKLSQCKKIYDELWKNPDALSSARLNEQIDLLLPKDFEKNDKKIMHLSDELAKKLKNNEQNPDYPYYLKLFYFLKNNRYLLNDQEDLIKKIENLDKNYWKSMWGKIDDLREAFNFTIKLINPALNTTHRHLNELFNKYLNNVFINAEDLSQIEVLLKDCQKQILTNILNHIVDRKWQVALSFIGKGTECTINDVKVILPEFVAGMVRIMQKGIENEEYLKALKEVTAKGEENASHDHLTRYQSTQNFYEMFKEENRNAFASTFGQIKLPSTQLSLQFY